MTEAEKYRERCFPKSQVDDQKIKKKVMRYFFAKSLSSLKMLVYQPGSQA